MGRETGRRRARDLTPEQVIAKRRRRLSNAEELRLFFLRLVLLAGIFVALFGIVFGIMAVPNNDMQPKLYAGDLLLYYRLEKEFHSQDVVVFQKNTARYVGRVMAKGGDTVEITEDSHLKVNNSTVYESNIFYSTPMYDTDIEYPVTLKEDEYFILCDYREGGKDSRYFGAVRDDEIQGMVIAVLRRSDL